VSASTTLEGRIVGRRTWFLKLCSHWQCDSATYLCFIQVSYIVYVPSSLSKPQIKSQVMVRCGFLRTIPHLSNEAMAEW